MMKQQFKSCVWLILMLLGITQTAHAAFKDFSVIVNNQTGTLLTSEEQVQGTSVSFGVAVDGQGAVSRVETSDASSVATVTGTYHGEHGCTGLQVVVPVEGDVKITVGQCTYSTNTITVKNSNNETVVTKSPSSPACWKNNHANVDELYYSGPATTLTISGMSYCPYVAVEAVQSVPQTYTISYSLGSETATGVLPVGGEISVGDTYTVSKNFTLYKEGYTLTGWTDGTNTYNVNSTITPESDLALTPVFTQNTVSLADRTDAVTLKWDFQRNNGAPTLNYGSNATGVYVTQAVVNGSTIDVKLDFNTGGSGKIANGSWGDWCQMNNGTTLTIPSCKNAVVSIEAFNALGTGDSPLTIDGQSDYTSAKTVSYTIANTANAIDVVIGSEGSYYRYIQTVLPVVEQSGGASYTNEAATVTWAMTDANNPSAYTAAPDGVFRTIIFDKGDTEITGTSNITDENAQKVTTGIKFRPSGTTQSLVWGVKPAAGLTFTPTKLSGYVNRCGTDAENGIKVSVYVGENEPTLLGTWTALRSGKTNSTTGDNKTTKEYDATAIYKYEITLTSEQQAALASGDGFYLTSTVGVGATKEGAFGEVKIEGLINGTVQDVPSYTLYAAPSDEGAGTVTVYPAGGTYNEGDEVKLTATPNFGYHFVNWTDSENNVLSTEAVYNHTVAADILITANFEAVQTYELAFSVEGGANSYMVTLDPAPTIVEGKNMYEAGTAVTLTALENEIMTFSNWSDGTTSAANTITMDGDKTLTATYSAVDYIAGWDFYLSGNRDRIADFASTSINQNAQFTLRNASGSTTGWLDKPASAGGYEAFKNGAAVNWQTLGEYYYQTKVNATDFANIQVKSKMLYNYNAYSKQLLQYSLDGETWNDVSNITMSQAKKGYELNGTLPTSADHAETLYLRWIPDYTSSTIGASGKDGTTITDVYILGEPAAYDDGQAPVLESSVPADNATGASSSGRIVLNFSEKVQLADGATATLGGQSLTGTVSNKTITFTYTGLDYSTAYTFNLSKESVKDLYDNNPAEDIVINFTTMARAAVEKGNYDFIVPTDGTFAEGIAAANNRSDKSKRYYIFVKKGTYQLMGTGATESAKDDNGNDYTYTNRITDITASNISIIGEDCDETIIYNTPDHEGIGVTATLRINSGVENTYIEDITIKNAWTYSGTTGRAVCLQDKGNKTICKNVKMLSYQDTYYSNNNNGQFFFEDGAIHGTVDFLCGGGDVVYNNTTLYLEPRSNNVITAPGTPKSFGYVFLGCTIDGDASCNGNYTLGRPWGTGVKSQFVNTTMKIVPSAAGWSEMGKDRYPAIFAESGSVDGEGNAIDLSNRKTSFGGINGGTAVESSGAELTPEQLAGLTIANIFGEWLPNQLTEQAPVPTDVMLNGTTLSWTGSDYALLYAICKDGSVVDFTTDATFEVDDPTATWTIRAANEMGGLSEASVEAVSVDLVLDETGGNTAKIQTLEGQTVSVKVERTLSPDYYNTLYLPFAMSADQIAAAFGEGVQVAGFTGMKTATTFNFKNVAAMDANTGYLVKPKAEVKGFTVENVEIAAIPDVQPITGGATDYSMHGSYDAFNNDGTTDVYYFTTKNTIKKLTVGGTIKGLRAFMESNSTNSDGFAREFSYVINDEDIVTGIESIDNSSLTIDNDAPVYNLAGQKVGKGYKGIVIKNGKKVVMK